ncbi:hypothetical protein [Paenibacillus tianjinensis]|uniref:Uncharacterized protein n=1 Tax=Paenibacillus tianjinensis TaxID=2810347 RepID=A0ABX7LE22_9BACL|nr:hypothetical protein [Paenibacillus tianjinensis]QSF45496.1 hypothetical protein JRJ22_02175 [Paenibacillus tianjinensis]
MPIYIVLIYAVIVLFDPYGLLKQGNKRDFYVCSVLCLVSFSLAFALSMHWEIPSPSPLIVHVVKMLF